MEPSAPGQEYTGAGTNGLAGSAMGTESKAAMTDPAGSPPTIEPGTRRLPDRALAVLLLALTPALAAVWLIPGFVTQDGPAHVYNAQILLEALRHGAASPFAGTYQVRWEPLPNWAGHLSLMGLLGILPARTAERAMTSLTLLAPALATLALRRRVLGRDDPAAVPAALATAVLAPNLTWLFGFWSFLLGVAAFALTLAVAGPGLSGGRLGAGRIATLGALLALGYLCHPISLGLTVLALAVLGLATPAGPCERRRRLVGLGLALAPLVPLGLVYLTLMRGGGRITPLWDNLTSPWSLAAWRAQLGWVDPVTLGSRAMLPFLGRRSGLLGLLTPVVWLVLGLSLLGLAGAFSRPTGTTRRGQRRGWLILAALFLIGGVAAPDSLGLSHGFYLAQRIVLLGLIVLAATVGPATGAVLTNAARRLLQLATAALALAAAVQGLFVLDYGRHADRVAGPVLAAASQIEPGDRLAPLWLDLRGPFRVNPLLHAESWLGVDTRAIVWSNYESAFYYFPVQIAPGVPHPPVLGFEAVSILDSPDDAQVQAGAWADLLALHHDAIDLLVIQGHNPWLEAITALWYDPGPATDATGSVRVWRHR